MAGIVAILRNCLKLNSLTIPIATTPAAEPMTSIEPPVPTQRASSTQILKSVVCIISMAAAVSDFRVESVSPKKIKRAIAGDKISIELVANPDILASSVTRIKGDGLKCLTVGFAAETASNESDLRQLAAHKLMSKGCDVLVANDVSNGQVFGSDQNSVLILAKSGIERAVSASKTEVANAILDILIEL
ncbi:MAG: hypothetical protein RL085_476 [Actinomycetota bacterium]